MKFPEPALPAARLVKGEYFTRLDVVCPYCDALPGQHCRTMSRHKAGDRGACKLKPTTSPFQWHAARKASWNRWVAELESRRAVRLIPKPDWVPWWACQWRGPNNYQAIVLVKSLRGAA